MVVTFTNSGTILLPSSQLRNTTNSGVYSIYNLDTNSIVSSGTYSNSSPIISYNMSNMHNSNDNFYVGFGGFGCIGEGRVVKGLGATDPILVEDFNGSYEPLSGTQILYQNFESGTASGFTVSGFGTGATSSGVLTDNTLEGSYCLGIQATNTASIYAIPTDPTTSGMLSGRTIFLVRGVTENDVTTRRPNGIGFAFLRQGSGISSNAYKVYFNHEYQSGNSQYRIALTYGQLGNGSNGSLDNTGTIIDTHVLEYSSSSAANLRDSLRNNWLIVEWEVDTTYEPSVKIGVYHKVYELGDTYDSVRKTATLLMQRVYVGDTDGVGLYTTTTEPVCWIASTTNSMRTAMDCIYLENIPNVTNSGLFNKKLLAFKGNDVTGEPTYRFNAINYLINNGVATGPQGSYKTTANLLVTNPFISSNISKYGVAGYGYSGLVRRNFGNNPFLSFLINDPNSSNIKQGVFRLALKSTNSRTSFSFLCQGPLFSDNCYTIDHYRSGTNDYRVRIRKGENVSSPYDNTFSQGGTILGTSSQLTGCNDGTVIWLEFRWKAGTSSTDFEIRYVLATTSLIYFDSSPGTIDTKLTSILSITDSASPYINTTNLPYITLMGNGADYPSVYKIELRKTRSGN